MAFIEYDVFGFRASVDAPVGHVVAYYSCVDLTMMQAFAQAQQLAAAAEEAATVQPREELPSIAVGKRAINLRGVPK